MPYKYVMGLLIAIAGLANAGSTLDSTVANFDRLEFGASLCLAVVGLIIMWMCTDYE